MYFHQSDQDPPPINNSTFRKMQYYAPIVIAIMALIVGINCLPSPSGEYISLDSTF